jgi:hypothetical protein
MSHKRLSFRTFVVIVLSITLSALLVKVYSQVVSAETFGVTKGVLSTINDLKDAHDKVADLQKAIGDVERGKEPHFGTQLGVLAERYEKAARALDNLSSTTGSGPSDPRFVRGFPKDLSSAIPLVEKYIQQLHEAEANTAADLSTLDNAIDLAEKRYQAAVQIAEFFDKLVQSPVFEAEANYSADFVDADQLKLAISSYKSSLTGHRNRVAESLKSLKILIRNAESGLEQMRGIWLGQPKEATNEHVREGDMAIRQKYDAALKADENLIGIMAVLQRHQKEMIEAEKQLIALQQRRIQAQSETIDRYSALIDDYKKDGELAQSLIDQYKKVEEDYKALGVAWQANYEGQVQTWQRIAGEYSEVADRYQDIAEKYEEVFAKSAPPEVGDTNGHDHEGKQAGSDWSGTQSGGNSESQPERSPKELLAGEHTFAQDKGKTDITVGGKP